MPAVIDAPERIDIEDIETHDFTRGVTIEQCPAHNARPGFWRMMTHGIIKRVPRTPRAQHAPAYYSEIHRFEAPMDRFLREHPSLAPYAFSIL